MKAKCKKKSTFMMNKSYRQSYDKKSLVDKNQVQPL